MEWKHIVVPLFAFQLTHHFLTAHYGLLFSGPLVGAETFANAAIALSDGTIAAITATEVNGDLSWGIARDFDQNLLSYPCIGCAPLLYNSGKQRSRMPYLACSLRGGSTYLIPLASSEQRNLEDTSDILFFSLPHCDEVRTPQYLQGFTAGNYCSTGSSKLSIPIFVYVWPGGVVDVYTPYVLGGRSCRSFSTPRDSAIFADGSVKPLLELLKSLKKTDTLLQNQLWKDAWSELREAPTTTAGTECLPKIKELIFVLSTKRNIKNII